MVGEKTHFAKFFTKFNILISCQKNIKHAFGRYEYHESCLLENN